MKKRWIPSIAVAAMIGISSMAVADETEMDFYISEDNSEEVLVAAEEDEDPFEFDGLIEDLEATEDDSEDIPIDETHFPDDYFRNYISENFDLPDPDGNKDGVLSAEEIRAVTNIDLVSDSYWESHNLQGIEYFVALTSLSLTDISIPAININGLSSLSELKLVQCRGLNSFDAIGHNSLTSLTIYDCSTRRINVSNCTSLETLKCIDTTILDLDLTGCISLKTLICEESNLTRLDLNSCTSLTYLSCEGNILSGLSLRHCPELT